MDKEKKKNEEVVARAGNFLVVRQTGNEHDWVCVKAVSGFWSVRYRDDNPMFAYVAVMCSKKLAPYLEAWIKMCYVMSNSAPDVPFMTDFFNAWDAYCKRRQADSPKHTEEEDAKTLEEIKAMTEIKEELDNGNG